MNRASRQVHQRVVVVAADGRLTGRWRARLAAVALSALACFVSPLASAQAQNAAPAPADLIVATKEAPPFAMKRDGQWTGIAIELSSRIGEKLGMHTAFREYQTVPEMLAAVTDGSANAAIAAITVTSEREKTVDFTQPYYESGLGVAVPAKKEIEWLSILRNIFTLRFFVAVAVLIGVAALIGSLIWFLERHETEHFPKNARGLGTGLWWAARR